MAAGAAWRSGWRPVDIVEHRDEGARIGAAADCPLTVNYDVEMGPFCTADKIRMTVWTILVRALFVVAVVIASLVPGVTVLGGVILVTALLVLISVTQIWIPPVRHARSRPDPPWQSSGDRFPRRPLPFNPTLAVERKLADD